MDAEDFRRIALSLEGAEESSHMGAADFRVGGRIFATLASVSQGYGNLKLTPEQQELLWGCDFPAPDWARPAPGFDTVPGARASAVVQGHKRATQAKAMFMSWSGA